MPRTDYRVYIPGNPQEIIVLGEAIIAKHTADGLNSPLSFMDMAGFEDLVTEAKAQDLLSTEYNGQKEVAFEARDNALGINANVTGTVDYYVKASRDILVGYYKNYEDKLNLWGFEVSKSKGTLKIEIPTAPEKMIKLATNILAKNTLEGQNSPIKGLNIVEFTAKNDIASAQDILAKEYKAKKEVATTERDTVLGIEQHQKLTTENTVRFFIISIRDVLVGLYKNTEQNLELWGYSVSIGPKPKPVKKSMQGTISDTSGVVIENASVKVVELNVIVKSDIDGNYIVPKQPSGIYTIQVSKTNYTTQTFNNIPFADNQVYELDVQLIPLNGTLVVTVYTEGQPLPNAIVQINELSLQQPTNAEGIATFNSLPPSTYNVTASAPGKQPQTSSVDIAPNSTSSLMFDLINE